MEEDCLPDSNTNTGWLDFTNKEEGRRTVDSNIQNTIVESHNSTETSNIAQYNRKALQNQDHQDPNQVLQAQDPNPVPRVLHQEDPNQVLPVLLHQDPNQALLVLQDLPDPSLSDSSSNKSATTQYSQTVTLIILQLYNTLRLYSTFSDSAIAITVF